MTLPNGNTTCAPYDTGGDTVVTLVADVLGAAVGLECEQPAATTAAIPAVTTRADKGAGFIFGFRGCRW
jgi:hypothetical protein